ncbi:MAG: Aspartokinase [Alectoria sarmentosa]|nr:MAG: Aspartokinase [Alectoria sarmentosa]
MVPLVIGGEFLSPRPIFTKAELTKPDLSKADLDQGGMADLAEFSHQGGFGGFGKSPRQRRRICWSSTSKQDGLSRLMHSRIENVLGVYSLLKASREAAKPNSTRHHAIVSGILHEHLETAKFVNPEIEERLRWDISAECNALEKLLDSLSKTEDVPPEAEDKILSVGEKLSARYLTALLEDHGILAQYVDLSDVIDFTVPRSLNQEFYRELGYAIGRRIELCGEKVPAVGTPICALRSLRPERERKNYSFYGSEVIHHFTVEQCLPSIPIRIKNVLAPQSPGTLITPASSAHLQSHPKRPTAVTVKHQITVVDVHSHRKVEDADFLAQICQILASRSLNIDLFEKNQFHISLADAEDSLSQHKDLQHAIEELSEYGSVDVVRNMAIISLVGLQLKRSIGIAGRLFTALGDGNINIEMISQGGSEISISCVIAEREALRALNVVHTDLFTFLD